MGRNLKQKKFILVTLMISGIFEDFLIFVLLVKFDILVPRRLGRVHYQVQERGHQRFAFLMSKMKQRIGCSQCGFQYGPTNCTGTCFWLDTLTLSPHTSSKITPKPKDNGTKVKP